AVQAGGEDARAAAALRQEQLPRVRVDGDVGGPVQLARPQDERHPPGVQAHRRHAGCLAVNPAASPTLNQC
ncbi:MAG: hypothetical protein ACK56F_08885, partial [bacterium]